ncbi:MAG: WG repeat-containing protein [Tenericutes bacterium]|nr:WG repeat-containing protein [Mycoplasmatota bacterium]
MKKSKKIIIIVVLILVVLVIGIYTAYYIFKNKGKKDTNYYYKVDNNSIMLLSNDKIVNFYNCNGECSVYENYFVNGRLLLNDNEKIYLYDLVKGSKLSQEYDKLYFVKDDSTVKYFVVNNGSLYGVMDLSGNVTVNLNYEDLGSIKEDAVSNFDVANDLISAKSNGLYGVVSLSNGKGVIDFQYDDIKISSGKIGAKTQDKWYLIGLDNRKISKLAFDEIILGENRSLVRDKNTIYFISSSDGNILSEKLVLDKDDVILKFEVEVLYIVNTDSGKQVKYIYNEDANRFDKIK